MSLQGTAFGGLEWMQWWTYFMMAWWVSWGAFVGVFLARISRGRTIRGFILGVLVVPSVVFFTWFTVFGGTAIHVDMFEGGDIAEQTAADINSAFFATLDHFPLATVTSVVAIILVVMFFVSGADANTYVLSMMTSGGSLTPRRAVLILWGVLTGVTAVVLMLAGGLTALQNTVIVASLPFLVIIAGLAVSFWKELAADRRRPKPAVTGVASARPSTDRPDRAIHDRPSRSREQRHVRQRRPPRPDPAGLGRGVGPRRGRCARRAAEPGLPPASAATDEAHDLTEFKASIIATRSAFPDLVTTIDEVVVEGDRAAIRWHSAGQHEHPVPRRAGHQAQVAVSGATFARFEDDRIVEEFVTWDPRALLTALGIISVGQDRLTP